MQPRKTELAHSALQAHRAPLDMRQRRLLILCDGHRDVAELTRLVGADAPAMVIQLIQGGYLSTAPAPEAEAQPFPPADAGPPAAAATGERRRSLVAAKMYLLDILQLQRHAAAAALHRQLRLARGDAETVVALRQALSRLPEMTSAGYAQRVHARVREALPEALAATLPPLPGGVPA